MPLLTRRLRRLFKEKLKKLKGENILKFNEYLGQKNIKQTLQSTLNENKLSHAYMLEGPTGMGKATLAKIFAEAILCRDFKGEACGTCSSCIKFKSGNHPDFYTISTDKASIGVDEIRDLQDGTIIKPIESDYKVYIIEQADKMTVQAQNCLLKTLEDPPKYVVIILCTGNPSTMLKTIQSRCIRLKYEYYSDDEIKEILKKSGSNDEQNIDFAAAFSQGIPGKAYESGSEEFINFRDNVINYLVDMKGLPIERLVSLPAFLSEENSIEDVLDIISIWYRDIAVLRNTKSDRLLINSDKKDIIEKNIADITDRKIFKLLELIEHSRRDLKRNVNFQMVIDNMLISFWEVING